eukprot:2288098-Lingulodinium_polyedra.AAC.1
MKSSLESNGYGMHTRISINIRINININININCSARPGVWLAALGLALRGSCPRARVEYARPGLERRSTECPVNVAASWGHACSGMKRG